MLQMSAVVMMSAMLSEFVHAGAYARTREWFNKGGEEKLDKFLSGKPCDCPDCRDKDV